MLYLFQGASEGRLTKTVLDSTPGAALVPWLACLSLLGGCGWIAADGPWNDPPEPTPLAGVVDLRVAVLTPDGGRAVAGAEVEVVDDDGAVIASAATGPEGEAWLLDVPAARLTLSVRTGHLAAWRVIDPSPEPVEQELAPLRLEAGSPVVLDVRDADGRLADPVGSRLEELGLTSVRPGPESAAAAAQLFALPAGLYEYGLVLIGGELNYPALLADDQAMSGLWDHLQDGGGLYLSGGAWPLLLALAPGAVELSDEASDFGYVEARVADPTWAEHLAWDRVGVPMSAGLPVLEAAGTGARVLLEGEVETATGQRVDGPLMVGVGAVVYATFAAPEPRPDEWWQGDPAGWELADGSWEGRGAVIDRALLQL